MSARVVILLALLVTATVVVPVVAASLVHRDSPVVAWVRSHLLLLWAGVALAWLVSLAVTLFHGSRSASLDLIVSTLGFVTAVCIALLHRPPAPSRPAGSAPHDSK